MRDKVPSSCRGVRAAQINRYASLGAVVATAVFSAFGCSATSNRPDAAYLATLRELQTSDVTDGASELVKHWVPKGLPANHRLTDPEIEKLQRDTNGCIAKLAGAVKVPPSGAARAVQLLRCMEQADWTYEMRDGFFIY